MIKVLCVNIYICINIIGVCKDSIILSVNNYFILKFFNILMSIIFELLFNVIKKDNVNIVVIKSGRANLNATHKLKIRNLQIKDEQFLHH